MHISHEHEFVHISLPYTKSTSTRKWLERDYGAKQYDYQHYAYVPEFVEDYFVWTTVREPKDRAVSLWRRIHRGPERAKLMRSHFEPRGIPFPETFTEWMKILSESHHIDYGNGPKGWIQYMAQADILNVVEYAMILRFEDVPDQLHQLPFVDKPVTDFPHYSRNGQMHGLTWDDVGTDEAEHYLNIWAPMDGVLYEGATSCV